MDRLEETDAKMQAEKAYNTPCPVSPYPVDQCEQTIGMGYQRRDTLREEAERSVGFHRELADKADRAAAFFRENPAFDEFIRLIRSGAIQI